MRFSKMVLLFTMFVFSQQGAWAEGSHSAWGYSWTGEKRVLDTRYVEGQGNVLVSNDGKVMTNYCFTVNPRSDILSDDAWGWPGLTFISTDGEFRDTAAVDAHYFLGQIVAHFFSEFKLDGINGKGGTAVGIVHGAKGNAEWTGKYIELGDGYEGTQRSYSSAVDLIAHEFAHGVLQNLSGFSIGSDPAETGALNEGFADIMGIYAKYKIQGRLDYLFGDDVFIGTNQQALRSLSNPKQFQGVDFYSSIDHGVAADPHSNGGVLGLAFFLFAQGGQHPTMGGSPVKGVGIDTAAHIFYETFTSHLKGKAKFTDARRESLLVASRFGASVEANLSSAWDLVGVPRL